jgi:hypothetical protein
MTQHSCNLEVFLYDFLQLIFCPVDRVELQLFGFLRIIFLETFGPDVVNYINGTIKYLLFGCT